ncbi:M28 family peptidase [candidate division TA06 bacterium]|nr:M28 family peptidase [candidate division TA06 bacterium]
MKKAIFLSSLFCLILRGPAIGQQAGIVSFADSSRLKTDLYAVTTPQFRNYANVKVLNQVAEYISRELAMAADTVCYQTYKANGVEYKNVIGTIGPKDAPRIIVGAHYDVAGNQPGADDNASGVAGLLELARLLSKDTLKFRMDFVAYTLEEPPFFRTEYMGSYVHAKSLRDSNVQVKGMVCLEMIGYFSDAPGSQTYPLGLLKLFYGGKGDYITVVGKTGSGKFAKQLTKLMKKNSIVKTRSFKGPVKLAGVDFSDHLNYWKLGFDAVMITNTAFYRNRNYHESTDALETLDIKRMTAVVDELYISLKEMNELNTAIHDKLLF